MSKETDQIIFLERKVDILKNSNPPDAALSVTVGLQNLDNSYKGSQASTRAKHWSSPPNPWDPQHCNPSSRPQPPDQALSLFGRGCGAPCGATLLHGLLQFQCPQVRAAVQLWTRVFNAKSETEEDGQEFEM